MIGHHNPQLVAALEAERAHKPRRITKWSPTFFYVDTAEDYAARRALAAEIASYDPFQRWTKSKAKKAANNDSVTARPKPERPL